MKFIFFTERRCIFPWAYRRLLLKPIPLVEWSANRKKPLPNDQHQSSPLLASIDAIPATNVDDEVHISSKRRGPMPGTNRQKRKAENELSTNPQSLKRRNREAGMTSIEKRIDNAKKADRAAIGWRIRNLRKADEYIAASKEEKERLEEVVRQETMHKRYVS